MRVGGFSTGAAAGGVPEVAFLLTLATYELVSFARSTEQAGTVGRWEEEASIGINSPHWSSKQAGLNGRCRTGLDAGFPFFDKVG